MNTKTGYLIDMDGVIYRENQLIPGAVELVELMRERAVPFLFLTNNSAPTPEDLVVKLRHMGISGLTSRDFYTSALNTADFLNETHPGCTAFVIGEAGLNAALQRAQIPNDGIAPDYVVVGECNPSTEKLSVAHGLLERGARLVATNPDNWCPVTATMTRPGAGALAAFLEASTGITAYFLGKPNPYMFVQGRKRLRSRADEIVMVGDTMETDIRGAAEIGLTSYLVLTGSTRLSDVGQYVYQPTCIIESVADLLEELRSGRPSARLKPVKTEGGAVKSGSRHQTDREQRIRPRPAMTRA